MQSQGPAQRVWEGPASPRTIPRASGLQAPEDARSPSLSWVSLVQLGLCPRRDECPSPLLFRVEKDPLSALKTGPFPTQGLLTPPVGSRDNPRQPETTLPNQESSQGSRLSSVPVTDSPQRTRCPQPSPTFWPWTPCHAGHTPPRGRPESPAEHRRQSGAGCGRGPRPPALGSARGRGGGQTQVCP